MTRLIVEHNWQRLFAQLGWYSCAQVLKAFSPADPSTSGRHAIAVKTVSSVMHPPVTVYWKRYAFSRASWRFWLRSSKAKREYENYEALAKLGIPCAQRIAWGEQRDWLGRLHYAFIVTQAVPDSVTLWDFIQKVIPTRKTLTARRSRQSIWNQLATLVCTMHRAGFFHNDLYWRNILVEARTGEKTALWWLDCPRGRFNHWLPSRTRQRIKDLAALDLAAEKLCSRSERLGFLKSYLSLHKLDHRGKELARAVVAYRRQRWPTPAWR